MSPSSSRPSSPTLEAAEATHPAPRPASPALSTASSSTQDNFEDAEGGAAGSATASKAPSVDGQDEEDAHEERADEHVGGRAGTDNDNDQAQDEQPGVQEGQDATDAPTDEQHDPQDTLASGLPTSLSSSSLASSSTSPPPPSSDSAIPPGVLKRTSTPSLVAVPRDAVPTPSSSSSKSRPTSVASLSSLNAAVAAHPNRLSLTFDDEDDALGPLNASTSSSSTSNPSRRPFSLSSEPETPTARTSPASSPNRPRSSLLSHAHHHHHHAHDPTLVGRENSPSLTQQVWRQSLGLGSSPLATPVGKRAGLIDVRLDDGEEDGEGEEVPGTPRGKALVGEGEEEEERRRRRRSAHRKSVSDSALPSGGANGNGHQNEKEEDEEVDVDGADFADESLDTVPSSLSHSSSALAAPPPPARDRQPSIATPHAADGFLSHRASANLSSLAGPVTPDNPPSRFGKEGVRELKASFEAVRRREVSEGKDGGQGAGAEGEATDWDFWGRVMNDYEEVARMQPRELSRAIQKGIPPALRGMTWQLMAAAKDPNLEFVYSELLKQSSPHEKSIARDLSRTFPKHEYFAEAGGVGQENLFNVVKAYSLYDDEVGYTQGLQFIVGPLLLNMPDEEAFCVLVRLMKAYDLRSHYTPNMPGLQLRLFQFDRLVEELLPGVFLHMLRQGVKSSMYASQWFLTLFGYRFPLELVSSVFDLVFAEGVEAVFRFAVALLKRNEHHLCQLEFEDLIEFLKNGLFEGYAPEAEELDANPDALYKVGEFVRDALQVRITPLMLDQFGEEWATLCAQQTAHAAELDSLRKANLQLSLQVRQLEASLAQVNTEHCELVKQVVAARLEREELEDELVKYKLAYADLSHANAAANAMTSPLQMRRQSEMSIASSIGDDAASSTSAHTAATSASSNGGTSGGGFGLGMGAVGGAAGRWFGSMSGASGGGGGQNRASSSAMSQRSSIGLDPSSVSFITLPKVPSVAPAASAPAPASSHPSKLATSTPPPWLVNDIISLSAGPYGDWRDNLAPDGFAIIRGAVPEERALAYRERFYGWLEKFPLGFKREDRSTYTQEHIPMVMRGGMFHHSVGHEAFLWELRQEPGLIESFAKLWGTDELLVSFDGANLSLPGDIQDPNPPKWPHIDQDAERRGFLCAQGLVNLAPNGPDDGGLMLFKGSHALNNEYFTEVWDGNSGVILPKEGPNGQTDFFGFTPEILEWFESKGCEWVKPSLNPGDLVIWDSRCGHYNTPPRGDRDRVAAYTCFMPARLAPPDQLARKQELFQARHMTTHWPCTNLWAKSPIVLRNGKQCPHVRYAPFEEPELTDRLCAFSLLHL
ncbi:hypothetical protein JCM8097_001518 [Rhodosporidiobolus ruineniae]